MLHGPSPSCTPLYGRAQPPALCLPARTAGKVLLQATSSLSSWHTQQSAGREAVSIQGRAEGSRTQGSAHQLPLSGTSSPSTQVSWLTAASPQQQLAGSAQVCNSPVQIEALRFPFIVKVDDEEHNHRCCGRQPASPDPAALLCAGVRCQLGSRMAHVAPVSCLWAEEVCFLPAINEADQRSSATSHAVMWAAWSQASPIGFVLHPGCSTEMVGDGSCTSATVSCATSARRVQQEVSTARSYLAKKALGHPETSHHPVWMERN